MEAGSSRSRDLREQRSHNAFDKPIMEADNYHFHRIIYTRSESLSTVHAKGGSHQDPPLKGRIANNLYTPFEGIPGTILIKMFCLWTKI